MSIYIYIYICVCVCVHLYAFTNPTAHLTRHRSAWPPGGAFAALGESLPEVLAGFGSQFLEAALPADVAV